MRVVFELDTLRSGQPPQLSEGRPEVGIPSDLAASDAIALSLGAAEEDATLLVRVAEHRTVTGEAARHYDGAFDRAAELEEHSIESILADASRWQEQGVPSRAIDAYRRAVRLLANDQGARLTLVLVSLAELEREQGQVGNATEHLDRALALAPSHLGALIARSSLARELGEPALAAALLLRLAPQLETSAQRVDVLMHVAEDSLLVARNSIAFASELIPDSVQLLHRLRAVNEAMGDYEQALSAAVRQAELIVDPRQRAHALVDAARLCSDRVHHTARAVALYEAAIEDDPEVSGAFEALEAELIAARDFEAVAQAYQRQLERLEGAGSSSGKRALLRKLGEVQKDKLRQPLLAVATLEHLVKLAPDDVRARVNLASLLLEVGETAKATRALETAAGLEPTRAETYRSLSKLLNDASDPDRCYSACSVLVSLGEADLDEQLIHAQYRPDSLPSPRGIIDDDAFAQLLSDDHPEQFDALAIALEEAAFEIWLDPTSQTIAQLPSRKDRVDPRATTVSAVRCFHWAAQLLGIPEPDIYVDPKISRVGAQLLPLRTPAVLLGRPVLSGRTMGELAFLAAHQFTYARTGWRLASLCGSQDELSAFVLAAASIVRSDLPELVAPRSRGAELAEKLRTYLDPGGLAALAALIHPLINPQGTIDVAPWLRSVERTACRAGLLACGDVTVAGTVLAVAGNCPSGQSAAERARSLFPFCVSQRHAALRHWLGVAVPSQR